MITLAIDFSTERRAVCATDHVGRSGVAMVEDRRAGALSLIERALEEAGIARGEVELIAVGLGPGSYTGIRSAIALAQGWQLGTSVKLTGISSVEVMAGSVNVEGEFEVLIDAQRGEFYRARFCRAEGETRLLEALRIVSKEDLKCDATRFSPDPAKLDCATEEIHPDARILAGLAVNSEAVAGELLAPIYLREAEFKKAPPAREIR